MSGGLRQLQDGAKLHDRGGLRPTSTWAPVRPTAPVTVLSRRDARPLNTALAQHRAALAPQAEPAGLPAAVRRWAATPDRIADLRAALAVTTELLSRVNSGLEREVDRFSARLERLEAEVRTVREEQARLHVFAAGRATSLLSAEAADHRFAGRLDAVEAAGRADRDNLVRLAHDIQALQVQGRTQTQALASDLQTQLSEGLAWVGVEVDGLEVRLEAELKTLKAGS